MKGKLNFLITTMNITRMIAASVLQYNFSECGIQGNQKESMRKLKYVFFYFSGK